MMSSLRARLHALFRGGFARGSLVALISVPLQELSCVQGLWKSSTYHTLGPSEGGSMCFLLAAGVCDPVFPKKIHEI